MCGIFALFFIAIQTRSILWIPKILYEIHLIKKRKGGEQIDTAPTEINISRSQANVNLPKSYGDICYRARNAAEWRKMLFALNPEWDEVQVGKGIDFPVDKTAIKIHFTQFRFHRILLWNGVDRGGYPHKGWKGINTKSTQFRYLGGKTAVLRPKSAFLSPSEFSTMWKTPIEDDKW